MVFLIYKEFGIIFRTKSKTKKIQSSVTGHFLGVRDYYSEIILMETDGLEIRFPTLRPGLESPHGRFVRKLASLCYWIGKAISACSTFAKCLKTIPRIDPNLVSPT